MARYSWGDAQRRRANDERLTKDAEAQQQALRDRIECERQEITDQIVKPFLQAMEKAGNPGSQRSQRRVRSWSGANYTVSTDGSWRCQISVPTGYREETSYLCESTPEGFFEQPTTVAQALQNVLLQILIQHRVPIPHD